MRNLFKTLIWISASFIIREVHAARILAFFSTFSPSHHFVLRPLIETLAKKGHHITYVTGLEWKDCPTNIQQRLITFDRKELFQKMEANGAVKLGKDVPIEEILRDTLQSPAQKVSLYNSIFAVLVEAVLSNPTVQNLVHSDDKYDVVLSESLRGQEAYSAFAHKFNATSVTLLMRGDNSWPNELTGLPDNPSYMVDASSLYTDTMNFWERMYNTYSTSICKVLSYVHLLKNEKIADEYMNYTGWQTRPPLLDLVRDQALVLTNSHHSVGYSYPKAPHVKEIGGMHMSPPKPIPEGIERKINENNGKGVIYFSMGSNIDFGTSSFNSNNLKKSFLEAFSKREELVLWKVKNFESTNKKLFTSSWFPQADILAHNQTKLFITHGGMLSLMEAARYGVPVIGIPFFGDQKKNIQRMVDSGSGILLNIWNVSEASLSWAINEIIGSPRYKENALKTSRIFPDRPMQPVEEAVYWIEYVLRHGKVLQPASVRMPFHQLYLLDVFIFVVFCTVFGLWFQMKICVWILLRVKRQFGWHCS